MGENEQTLAMDASQLADAMGISLRHLRRMQSNGKLGPQALRFGRSVRFSVQEVKDWIRAGAPDRATWDRIRKDQEDVE